MTRQGKGWFEQRLGPDVEIQWFTYNAGPSAMETIFAGSLDVTYVGTGPALNAHWKANGAEIRVIGGGANGGSALVVAPEAGINKAADLRGKKIAAAVWKHAGHLLPRVAQVTRLQRHDDGRRCDRYADVESRSAQLLQSGRVQAVWTVEPWVTRLEREAKGRVLVEERDVITTWLISSAKFLKENADMAKKIAAANAELTEWDQGERGRGAEAPD